VQSDFLFAQPRALFGVARLLAIFSAFSAYNVSASPQEADARAMWSDWYVTGCDLKAASNVVQADRTRESDAAQGTLFPPA